MKKILVTGGAGFVGHHFIRYVLQSDPDCAVVCLDRLDPASDLNRLFKILGPKELSRLSVCYHNLRAEVNPELAKAVIDGCGNFDHSPFDYAVHMAAGSHVDRSVADPVGFVKDNVVGTANFLDFFRRTPGALRTGGKILYFSTDEVFGPASEDESFSEWDRFNPNNPYSAAKAGGEVLCGAYANTYGMPVQVTHCTNVFGEQQHPEKFIPLLIRKVLLNEIVQIHSDRTRTRPASRFYTYVDNVSSAVLHVLRNGEVMDGTPGRGKYNISGDREIDNLELARMVAAMLGRDLRHELVDYVPSRPKHDMRYAVRDDLLRSIGWAPSVSFEAGLRKTVDHYLR